jgi:hypothetical protein
VWGDRKIGCCSGFQKDRQRKMLLKSNKIPSGKLT